MKSAQKVQPRRWSMKAIVVCAFFAALGPIAGCGSSAADDRQDADEEENECYSEPLTSTCENGGGARRCYSYPSFYPWWPPRDDGAGGASEVPYCPPPDVLIKTQDEGACGHNLVEVCSEAEQVGEECCYDTIHYTYMSCCG